MSKYNFNKIINRKNSGSLKYDFAVERGMPKDVLPLWVADMDFKTANPILDALKKAIEHGVFGYNEVKRPYFSAIQNWYKRYFNFELKEEWLLKTPGVVFALAMAVKAFSNK
ncbi:MAG: aminotransferase, partial [Fusobacterium sp.]|nr:aminotransferase [Fusobacterium sp.]